MRVPLGEVELSVEVHGEGDPPLVLVHGYTGGTPDWADVAPALAGDGRRVVTFDHRGHGQSTNTGDEASYSFDALAADLGGLVDALDLAPMDLLGHSMGGVVALRHALDHPETVRSLVLMDTGAEPSGEIPVEGVEALAAVGRDQGSPAMFAMMRPVFEAGVAAHAEDRRATLLSRVEAKWDGLDPAAFVGFAKALNSYPSMVSRLGELRCPVTVLVGANDTGLRGAAEVLAENIPGARLVVIPDAGHCPQEDRPELWLQAVREHLARSPQVEAPAAEQ